MRDAVAQAKQASQAAAQASGQYGANAATINANLTPFLTRQLTNPTGESQRDISSQVTNALAGAGGSTSGLTGAADAYGTRTRNPIGFSAALDSAARSRDQAAARASEGVAANNVGVKLNQQDQAAKELGSMYGTDVSGQLGANRNQIAGSEAMVNNAKSGWMQQFPQAVKDFTGAAAGVAGLF